MAASTLWQRLRKARIVRVAVVYLGVSWAVVQLVDTLMGMLQLPPWLGPVTVILLGVGFVVITATAWVQSLESTTEAEEAGEVPTDWEVAPSDILASLKEGRLPHLTWGRAVVGGIVAISLAVGAAGGYVLVRGGAGIIGPTSVGAEGTPTAVAVLPFQTRGADLDVYGEGMVDLLAPNLEGLGGLRTINSGTVVARWQSELGRTVTVELDQALAVAGGLNARYAVRGNVVDAGGRVRLTAEVFDVVDGRRIDDVQVEGSADDMLQLVDDLTVELATVFIGADPSSQGRADAIDTRSLDALEAYREARRSIASDGFGTPPNRSARRWRPTRVSRWRGRASEIRGAGSTPEPRTSRRPRSGRPSSRTGFPSVSASCFSRVRISPTGATRFWTSSAGI